MAKRMKVPMSSARARLFQLADLVRQSEDDTVVVLEARGGAEPVALVRESRLAFLEDQAARRAPASASFALAGSLSTELDDDTLSASFSELRRAWSRGATRATPKRPPAAPRATARSRRPR